jgi:hypothetical protein
METFDFWAKEWPVITQAPHIALAGLVVVLAVTWSAAKRYYSDQLSSQKERIELLQERERDVKEKLIDAQSRVVELNDKIQANEHQPALLKSSNYTVAAFEHLVSATDRLGATLATARLRTRQRPPNPLIPLTWRQDAADIWRARSSWPDVGFRIEMESSNCFMLLGGGTRIGECASLDDAKQSAEDYRYQMLMEEMATKSRS